MIDEIQTYQTEAGTVHLEAFVEAELSFHFTEQQLNTLVALEQSLVQLKKQTGKDWFPIDIGKTSDDEISISRNSVEGISNLLIYEDGTMAHSFIPYKGSSKSDFLHFFEPVETIKYEHVLLEFFSY